MAKFILAFFLIIFLFLGVFFIFLLNYQKSTQKSKEAVINTGDLTFTNVLVDKTEDLKALGFSGQNKLASDSKGNIFAAYRKKVNDYYEIFVAKIKKEDGLFEVLDAKNVSNIGNRINQRVPSLAIDSKDNIHIVWYGADSSTKEGDRQIKYSKSSDSGETWSKTINISFVEGYSSQPLWQEHPDIFAGKDDILYVVWEGKDKDKTNQQIKFSKSGDGVNFSKWMNVTPTSISQSRPSIVQDKTGRLYIFMYSKNNSAQQQIWLTTSDNNGATWSDLKNISNSLDVDARHVDSVIDSQDKVHVVWRQYDKGTKTTQIYYSKFDGKDWSNPLVISKSSTYQFFPHVGVDKNDLVFVTWLETSKKSSFPEDDPKEGDSYLSYLSSTHSSFSNKTLISNNSYFPSLIPNSNQNNKTYVLYSTKEKNYPIYFSEISLQP